ncbi:MAG: A/G-specific adenine glycosylase [Desulfocapsa sp.]|nr:A/G-specific adenine glycosylase [Desulfocapsa sp.]
MSEPKNLQDALLDWFDKNQRDLPWRHNYEPYQVWISEIMLQQTQMDRVTLFFNHWMETFPDIKTLAAASEDQVLKCWEGLGYYSRARNIRRTAKLILEQYQGEIPAHRQELLQLPGIGPYTAGAIASISFNRNVPVVDANVERIFARLFDVDLISGSPEAKRLHWQKAEELLPHNHARNFNQGLMELGALICRPKKPNCSICPLVKHCLALKYDLVSVRPIPKKSTSIIPIEMATGVLIHNEQLFIQQRLADDVWGSLWEFPGGRLEKGERPEQTVVREFLEETELKVTVESKITATIHHYTRYKVTLHCFLVSLAQLELDPVLHAAQEFHWLPFKQLDQYAFPAGHRKLIEFMKANKLP